MEWKDLIHEILLWRLIFPPFLTLFGSLDKGQTAWYPSCDHNDTTFMAKTEQTEIGTCQAQKGQEQVRKIKLRHYVELDQSMI